MSNEPKDDNYWRAKLSPEQFRILRLKGTERAFSSALNNEKRSGLFYCAACGEALFKSDDKFDSGCGWPSFTQPVDETQLGSSTDFDIGYARIEIHCAKCGGHMGHVFDDGPAPSGKRYCINGAALNFREQDS